jgi:hypothetical protein
MSVQSSIQRDASGDETSARETFMLLPMQVALWAGDELVCVPADALPHPSAEKCGGCAACCPPERR